jgi:DNA (cytosine-5)-methyltransferase 1
MQGVCEIDKFPSAVLKHRYPLVPNLGDVTNVTSEKVKSECGTDSIDILIGGSPCQSFSVAGARGGTDDPRGQLMYEYIRVVGELKPRYFVWENVKGALTSNGGRDFGTLLACMDKLGYDLEWEVLDTQHFGLPQSRSRVYLVGHLREHGGGSILFDSKVNRWGEKENRQKELNPTQITGGGVKVIASDTERFISNGRTKVGCLCARDYKGLGSDCVPMGKVVVDASSERIKLRRLTPVEYERLQGFPDDWTRVPWNGKTKDKCPDGHRYKALGNSMSIPVVRWVGERLVEHSERT